MTREGAEREGAKRQHAMRERAMSPRQRLAMYAVVGALGRAANAGLPTAIILSVLAAGGTTTTGSVIVAALTAVAGISGPFMGAAIDRTEHPKRGYLVATLVLLGCASVLAVGIGSWPTAALMFVAGIAGLAHPLLTGAWSAQLRRVVPDFPPARSYAIDVGTYNAADILGPALAGTAYIIDATTPGASALEALLVLYVGAFIALIFVPIPARSDTHERAVEPMLRTMRGLMIFWRSRSLRRTTVISTIAYSGIACVVVSAPLLGSELAGDAGKGALLLAVLAAGALVGAIILARRPVMTMGPGTLVVWATLVVSVTLVLLALSPVMWVAIVLAFLVGLTESPQLNAVMQVRDREAPAHVRGLVFVSAASIKTGAFAVGSLIGGALAVHGWRTSIAGAAALEFIAIAVGLLIGGRRPRN